MDQFLYKISGKDMLVYRSVYAPVKSNMFTIITGEDAVVFDPNIDEDLLKLLDEKDIKRVHILLTHGHYDHISGVEWLKEKTNAIVFCHLMCAKRLMNPKRPLARLVAVVLAQQDREDGGHRYQDFSASYKPFTIHADRTFEEEETLEFRDFLFHVISTPGHSEGSACYEVRWKKSDESGMMVFTGDTLIQHTPAITTFPGGNKEDYKNKALPYLQSLPKDTIIMPGHGDPFVLKDTNNI